MFMQVAMINTNQPPGRGAIKSLFSDRRPAREGDGLRLWKIRRDVLWR